LFFPPGFDAGRNVFHGDVEEENTDTPPAGHESFQHPSAAEALKGLECEIPGNIRIDENCTSFNIPSPGSVQCSGTPTFFISDFSDSPPRFFTEVAVRNILLEHNYACLQASQKDERSSTPLHEFSSITAASDNRSFFFKFFDF